MIIESAVRDKWPLDWMSEINCHGEIAPRPGIEAATPVLQIRCPVLILSGESKWLQCLFNEMFNASNNVSNRDDGVNSKSYTS